jgi:hypothetical protein
VGLQEKNMPYMATAQSSAENVKPNFRSEGRSVENVLFI